MALGKNLPVEDRLIRKTTGKANKASKTSRISILKEVKDIMDTRSYATQNTVKMTFYVKQGLLKKLYNFAFWERLKITDAFNLVLRDGLKGKNTKDRGKND